MSKIERIKISSEPVDAFTGPFLSLTKCRCGASLIEDGYCTINMLANMAPVLGVPGVHMVRAACRQCGVEISSTPTHSPRVLGWFRV